MTSDELKQHFSEKCEEYREVFEKDGLEDEIEMDGDVLRWKANPSIELLFEMNDYGTPAVGCSDRDLAVDLNTFWARWYGSGFTKNDARVRKLYRDMGYSVSGYYDIFFWDVNNDIAGEWEGENGSSSN